MRIIGGQYKGRRIPINKSFKARPTTDFAKENLFNILSNNFYFEDICMLDLFSGTGSISLEFASRGCSNITLVENNFKHYSFIKSTIESIPDLRKIIKPLKGDAFKFLKKNNTESAIKYDIIFADPPYDLPAIDTLPDLVFVHENLQDEGWFILEHSQDYSFTEHKNFLELRKYGSVHFSIFTNKK